MIQHLKALINFFRIREEDRKPIFNKATLNFSCYQKLYSVKIDNSILSCIICTKNLTFPNAERDQRCPRLVVVILCSFVSIKEFDWVTPANNKSDEQIEKNKQKTTTTKRGHR